MKVIVDDMSIDEYLTPKAVGAVDKVKAKYENVMAEFNIKRKVEVDNLAIIRS